MRNAIAAALVAVLASVASAAPHVHKPRPLKVVSFKPHHTQMQVPVDVVVAVKFSRSLDVTSVIPATAQLLKLSGEVVDATYSFQNKSRLLLLKPTTPLLGSTDYQVVVRSGLLAWDGGTLKADRHANFYTKAVPFSLLRPDQFDDIPSTMVENRAAHSAVMMASRGVLLAAGMTDYTTYAISGDVFDPATNEFHPSGGRLWDERAYAPGVPFGFGAMLVGGSNNSGALASTEVYLPVSAAFQRGPALLERRDYVAAVGLKDGRVLVVGGLDYTPTGALYSLTAEIYDPGIGGFRFTKGAPVAPRAGHTATLLPDGRVFIIGGQSGGVSTPVIAEIFDPATETFQATSGAAQYQRSQHSATVVDLLGRVLVADGGASPFELYDASSDEFHPSGAASIVNRYGATASLLPDGNVLVAGGLQNNGDGNMTILDGFDLWKPSSGDYGGVFRPDVVFTTPRYGHTATTLDDGRVLYAGGFGPNGPDSLNTAVIFTPDPPK